MDINNTRRKPGERVETPPPEIPKRTKSEPLNSTALPPATVECTASGSADPSAEPPFMRPKPFCKNVLNGAAVPTTLEKARSTGEGEWADFPYIKINRRILYDVPAARKILAGKPRLGGSTTKEGK